MPFHFRDFFEGSTGPTPLATPESQPPSMSLFLRPDPPPLPRTKGLCSFLADVVVLQVDVRQGCVDFQRFGEGLWPKAMASRKTCDAIYKDTSHAGWTRNYVTVGTNKKLKYKGQMMLKEGKAKKVELQLHESGKQCPNFPTNSWIFRFSFAMRTRWDVPQ